MKFTFKLLIAVCLLTSTVALAGVAVGPTDHTQGQHGQLVIPNRGAVQSNYGGYNGDYNQNYNYQPRYQRTFSCRCDGVDYNRRTYNLGYFRAVNDLDADQICYNWAYVNEGFPEYHYRCR